MSTVCSGLKFSGGQNAHRVTAGPTIVQNLGILLARNIWQKTMISVHLDSIAHVYYLILRIQLRGSTSEVFCFMGVKSLPYFAR